MPLRRAATARVRAFRLAVVLLALAALLGTARAASTCTGDCDGSGTVEVNELVTGVAIALGARPLADCDVFDDNGDGQVTINELLLAVAAALNGCPLDGTATVTATPAPTATATPDLPPVLASPFVYRAYPGFPIAVPLGATDPEGGGLTCTVDQLPVGAELDAEARVVHWTPAADQLGAHVVPFTCSDEADPPQAVSGQLTFAVAPLDACTMPACDPPAGCTSALPPPEDACCAAGPAPSRVIEPAAGCPEGRVLYIGRNVNGFGRLQNCDGLRLRVFQQAGAEVLFHVQTRCMNTNNRVRLRARMESASPSRRVVFDTEQPPFFLDVATGTGFAERRNLRFGVSGPGPFFDLEDEEVNLTVTLTDSDGVSMSTEVRLILSSTRQLPDLPDGLDPP